MKYTLTKDETEIIATDKQFIITRGERRVGKTFTAYSLIAQAIFTTKYVQQIFVVLPSVRFIENFINNFIKFLGDGKGGIIRIDRNHLYIDFWDKSRIQFFIPSDILRYQFRGYPRPDLIIIDDAGDFTDYEQRRLFYAIKENWFLRAWSSKLYVSYYPVRKIDKLQALYRYANKNWYKTTLGVEK